MLVVFRVDQSPDIGSGHFNRCLSLAKILKKRGVNIKFVCRRNFSSEKITKLLRSYNISINFLKNIRKKTKNNKMHFYNNSSRNFVKDDARQTLKILKNNKKASQ